MKKTSTGKFRYKIKAWQLVVIALWMSLSPTLLGAEWRTYSSKQFLSGLLESLLQQMQNEKISFQVKKVFNEKTEGKRGFILRLKRTGAICQFLFYSKANKETMVKVFTQNNRDSRLFHRLLSQKLKMKEIGVFSPTQNKR